MSKTFTLKNARRLEQEIAGRVRELNNEANATLAGRSVSVYEDLTALMSTTAQDALNRVLEIGKLVEVRYAIRARIAAANETSGLNAAMVREQVLKERSAALSNLTNQTVLSEQNVGVLTKRLSAIKAGIEAGTVSTTSSRYGDSTDEIHVSGFNTEAVKAEAKRLTAELKAEIQRIADECSHLNLSTTITVSDEEAALLTGFGLTV